MSEKSPSSLTEKTVTAYNRMVERVEKAIADLENSTWETVKREIDEAVTFEQELAELTREEVDLLGAYVRRDLESLTRFMSANRSEIAEWLKMDLALVEKRIKDSLMSIADKTLVEQVELDHKTHHDAGAYVKGEVASPGMLKCSDCGYMMCLTETTVIQACHDCGNGYFQRITARWPRTEADL